MQETNVHTVHTVRILSHQKIIQRQFFRWRNIYVKIQYFDNAKYMYIYRTNKKSIDTFNRSLRIANSSVHAPTCGQ